MKVLVTASASGGHIFPALSFIDALKEKDGSVESILALPKRSLRTNFSLDQYRIRYLSLRPLRFSLRFKTLIGLFMFIKGGLESLFLLIELKPDVVVGFGGLETMPLVIFAWVARIKTLIHEQNVVPGTANRLLAKFVDKVAVSFSITKEYLHVRQEKIVVTGNPIRRSLKKIDKPRSLEFFGFDNNKFTILVAGGSFGSHKINTVFLQALSCKQDSSNLQVIHLCGAEDFDELSDKYKNLKLKVKLFSFFEDMQVAYSACDLVICRAGAGTVAELINFQIPAIIIPYPFAKQHQLKNAKILEKAGTAVIIEDSQLNAEILNRAVNGLMRNTDKIKIMKSSYGKFDKIDANELLVSEALSFR